MEPALLAEIVLEGTQSPLPEVTRRNVAVPDVQNMALAVIGMRRAGKTWFLYDIMRRLLGDGVARGDLLYMNFEDDRLAHLTVDHMHRIDEAFYAQEPGRLERMCWFFLDEVQLVTGWERYVRRLLDSRRVRVVVSGSSAKMLSREIATSLRGRGLELEITPFSFAESLQHFEVESPTRWPVDDATRARLREGLQRYASIGGFPDVQRLDAPLRERILTSYVDVVLMRDIMERHEATNGNALRALTRQLLGSPTCEFSITKLHNDLRSQGISVSRETLYTYLDHLKDAFLVYPTRVDDASERRQRVRPRKVYVVDHALAKANVRRALPDRGHVLENMVYMELRRRGFSLGYGVSEEGWGVDFVARRGGEELLVQSCHSLQEESTRERELRGLRSMMQSRKVETGLVVTWDDPPDPALARDGVHVMPAWRWMLDD